MSDEVTNTIEVPNTEVVEAKAPVAPSRSELKEKGWSAAELAAAEKHGMIQKPEEKKETVKPEIEVVKPESKLDEEKRQAERRNSSLPEFTFKTPEQEKAWLDAFGPGTEQRAMYFRMKNERQQRQQAERTREQFEQRTKALEEQIAALKAGRVEQQTDENGNVIDPEDKPLTIKQWKELQRQEAEEKQRQQQELQQQGNAVSESLRTQEEYAKSVLPDYEDTLKLAKEVMQDLENLVPNKWEQEKAIELIKALQVTAANADKYGIDNRNAALISYEIGQLHPNYRKSLTNGVTAETDNDGKQPADPKKANGSLTPEQMKRAEQNTQRRASSASIPGGSGRRVISADEVDLKDLNSMSDAQRSKFKKDHPARYDKLLRG